MSVYTLKPVTDSSWILLADGNKLAIVVNMQGSLKLIGGNLKKSSFKDIDELSELVGSKVTIELAEDDSVEELGTIGGYPVKHRQAVAEASDVLPLYKKTVSSNTMYSAGYYGIRFNHGWVTSYCPKATTLQENEYIGPFTTKLEMQNAISQKKKEIVYE